MSFPYTEEMMESVKKVEATRAARMAAEPRRMTAEEKDALLAYMWMTDLMSSIDCYELLNKKEGDVLSGQ